MNKRTGVIVGMQGVDGPTAAHVSEFLGEKFPNVTFAIIPGANSVAFEFETYAAGVVGAA